MSVAPTAPDPFARVLDALEHAGRRVTGSGVQRMAQCPGPTHARGDRNPSLSITRAPDKVLLFCHSGCAQHEVIAALGLAASDLFDDPPRARGLDLVTTYDYTDEDGALLYQAVRFVGPDGKKTFRQRRPDGSGGWTWRMGDVRLVPYRLPEVVAAAADGRPVYVVEGEKDADRLVAELRLTATTSPMGAGKWREGYAHYLKGARDVLVIADHDEPGMRHAADVARSLTAQGTPVRVLHSATRGAGHDISDHLAAGFTGAQLVECDPEVWLRTHSATPAAAAAAAAPAADSDDTADTTDDATVIPLRPGDGWTPATTAPSPATSIVTDPSVRLPDEVWDASPRLAHIRDAARAAITSPEALLVSVLAALAAHTRYGVVLPGIVGGSTSPLNLYAAVVGPPGTGKTSVHRLATRLLADTPARHSVADVRLSTGEGLVAAFAVMEQRGDPKKGEAITWDLVWRSHHVHAVADEVATLAAVIARSGSTLVGQLCSAWSGDTLGFDTRDRTRSAKPPAGCYRLAMTLGMQPEHGAALLRHAGTGLPQRFLFAPAGDPREEADPEDPGPLPLPGPPAQTYWALESDTENSAPYTADVDPAIVSEIRDFHRAVQRGAHELDALEVHDTLNRLRVAALLRLLTDDTPDVDAHAWALAGEVMRVSRRVRAGLVAEMRAAVAREDAAKAMSQVRIAETVRDREESRVEAGARALQRLVAAHARTGRHEGPCVGMCVNAATRRHRDVVTQVLTYADAADWCDVEWVADSRAADGRAPRVTPGSVDPGAFT